MSLAVVCGKLSIHIFDLLTFVYSIVMEYSDNGDLFQKITRHQKEQ